MVDDGSSDGTEKIIGNKFGPRVVYIYQENNGVSAARNTGIKNARGQVLAFCDSDDLWEPEKLERQVDFLTMHPDTLLCYTDEQWVKDSKTVNKKRHQQKGGHNIFERSLEQCIIGPSSFAAKKEVFDRIGLFNENFPACEDYEFWLRVTSALKTGYIDEELTIKRAGHANQLSTAHSLDKYRIKALYDLLMSHKLSPQQAQQALKALSAKCIIFAQGCVKHGKVAQGVKYLALPETIPDSAIYGKSI